MSWMLLLADVSGEGNYEEPSWFKPLMQISDRYGFILWPAVGVAVLGALAFAFLRAATNKSIPSEDKVHFKREIVQELRRKLSGLTIDEVGRMIGHPAHLAEELLEEMRKDGMVARSQDAQKNVVYQVRV